MKKDTEKEKSTENQQIRIIKRKKGHEAHHGGAWKVAYADFVTALMAFFLVMWIVGLSQNVKDAIAGYFKDPSGFMAAVKAGNAPFSNGLEANKEVKQSVSVGGESERDNLEKMKTSIEKMVAGNPEFKQMKKYVDVQMSSEGLKIELLEAKESLFFDSASATVKPTTKHLLAMIADELKKLPNKVIMEGHTDNRPLARTDGYTNWELSADRANSARRVMEDAGLRPKQVAQVRGYADTQPRDPNNPSHFSNRRVSIIVLMTNATGDEDINSLKVPKEASVKPNIQIVDNK